MKISIKWVDLFDEWNLYWTFWQKTDSVRKIDREVGGAGQTYDQLWDDLAIVWTYDNNNASEIHRFRRNRSSGLGRHASSDVYSFWKYPRDLKLKSWTIRLEMRLESSVTYPLKGHMHTVFWNLKWAFTVWLDLHFDSAKRSSYLLYICWSCGVDDTIEVEVRDIKMDTFRRSVELVDKTSARSLQGCAWPTLTGL